MAEGFVGKPADTVKPCLFLSHSGADTEAARELRRRILASPAAREAGLEVWFDKDDLLTGKEWQNQLEEVLTKKATAFAVYVGSKGVINWVEREVRLALSRATGKNDFPFIPILSPESSGSTALPPFAAQYHGVRDPLGDEKALATLIKAALGGGTDKPVLTDQPFIGLRAMTEEWSDRFFGREKETNELVALMRRHRLVAIVAESGAGKSSLAMAGFAPRFRGGALEETGGREPDERVRHVVIMRPGADPTSGLKDGIDKAARALGFDDDHRYRLRERVDLAKPYETAHAIRCDLSPETAQTLLIVDQFEELLTQTQEAARQPFVELLLWLAENGFHVLLTIRSDYFNLLSAHDRLWQRLAQDNSAPVYRLRRISNEGLVDVVKRPLVMAGLGDSDEIEALAHLFKRDMMDQPGDLALVQMALDAVWRRRKQAGGLSNAYASVGGIAGALAHAADAVRTEKLNDEERALLVPLFVRLVRLGDTGGVIRRAASFDELGDVRAALARKLTSADFARLLATVSGNSVEVAHEALVTQWVWLQNQIGSKEIASSIRRLGNLTDDAAAWMLATAPEKPKTLANRADFDRFSALKTEHSDWLSGSEINFVSESGAAIAQATLAEERRREAELQAAKEREAAAKKIARRTVIGTMGALAMGGVAGFTIYRADKQQRDLDEQLASDLKSFWAQKGEDTALQAVPDGPEETRPGGAGADSGDGQTVVSTWAIKAVGADQSRYTGRGSVIALVGTGVEASHPAFRGVTLIQKDFTGTGNGDLHGHDTHNGGTIFGRPVNNQRFGVAPGVSEVLVAKVLDVTGLGGKEAIWAALRWVINHPRKVDVVCVAIGQNYVLEMSSRLGGSVAAAAQAAAAANKDVANEINEALQPEVAKGLRDYWELLRTYQSFSAVAASVGKGAVLVMPAGNDSMDKARAPVTSPISLPQGVISVGAVQEGPNGYTVPYFSNSLPTLTAPGFELPSATVNGGITAMTGTSMACACAAGVAALWWEYLRSKRSAAEVTSRMVASEMLKAVRPDVFAPEVQEFERGAGLIQAPPNAE